MGPDDSQLISVETKKSYFIVGWQNVSLRFYLSTWGEEKHFGILSKIFLVTRTKRSPEILYAHLKKPLILISFEARIVKHVQKRKQQHKQSEKQRQGLKKNHQLSCKAKL